MFRRFKHFLRSALFLLKSGGGFVQIAHLARDIRSAKSLGRQYRQQVLDFRNQAAQLDVSTEWFFGNVGHWLHVFTNHPSAVRPARILEIGCWEGLSTYFLASHFQDAHLDCVDTWDGGDEHKASEKVMSQVESRYEKNLSPFRSNITKHKMLSSEFFKGNPDRERYDLIYVDGSHYADDVLGDALHSFRMLKVGGILIFDDLLWFKYDRIRDNPAAALMCFLFLKKGEYKVVYLNKQLIIQKTTSADRSVSPTAA